MFALLGGMSWVSSHYCYELLSTSVERDFLLLHLHDLPFRYHLTEGRYDEAFSCWNPFAKILASDSVSSFAICCNSAHVLEDHFPPEIREKMVSLPNLTLAALPEGSCAGLLSTSVTVGRNLYQKGAAERGIRIIAPDAHEVDILNATIFQNLTESAPSQEDIDLFKNAATNLLEAGADYIILGCTELSLLYEHLDPHTTICPLRVLQNYLKNT